MVGQTVLQYQIIEKIASGGMGEIYKAQDTRLNRLVAIKVLPPALSADSERRRRFIQEAQSASALNHPNIITIYDIVSVEGAQYMVMEYVAGRTLRDVTPPGGLPVQYVLQYATQIAGALSVAHAANIVHRDLKPANIMVTGSGLIKILDFGLAKLTDSLNQFADQATIDEAPLTREGSIIGTVSYMSPEQAEGKKVDSRSDIFSFGSVMYEMVTGRRAFDGGSGISTLTAVLRDEVKPISQVTSNVPEELEQIINRCLRKDPDARWQSMKEIEDALASLKRRFEAGIPARSTVVANAEPPAVPVAAPPPVPGPPPIPVAAAAAPPPIPPATPSITPPTIPPGPAAPSVAAPAAKPAVAAAKPQSSSKSAGLILALLGLLIVLAAGVGGWWWWNNQRKQAAQSGAQIVAPQTSPAPAPTTETTPPSPAPDAAKPAEAAATEPVLTNDNVIDMVASKIPTGEIVERIRGTKTNFDLSAEQLARLRQAGVPAAVLQAMRNPTAPAVTASAKPPAKTPPVSQPAQTPAPVQVTQSATPAPPPPVTQPANKATTKPAPVTANKRAVPVTVGDALPFMIVLAQDVPADAKEGDPLRFTVLDGFVVGDVVVIPSGATVTGMVAAQGGKKFLGIGNKMTFRLMQADAVGGQKVNVRASAGRRTDGPTVRPFDTGQNSKVKGLAAPKGSKYVAYIDAEQTVTIRK